MNAIFGSQQYNKQYNFNILFFVFFVYSCHGKLSLISVSGHTAIVSGGNNFLIKVNTIHT